MGTDIHAFIDYDCAGHLYSFSEGPIELGRDYDLFYALAGNRRENDDQPLYPPRGLPKQVSRDLLEAYFHPIVDDEDEDKDYLRGVSYVLRSKVEAMQSSPFYKRREY